MRATRRRTCLPMRGGGLPPSVPHTTPHGQVPNAVTPEGSFPPRRRKAERCLDCTGLVPGVIRYHRSGGTLEAVPLSMLLHWRKYRTYNKCVCPVVRLYLLHSWGQLGTSWCQLGQLGTGWGHLGTGWGQLSTSWGWLRSVEHQLGLVEVSWAPVGVIWVPVEVGWVPVGVG